MRSRSRETSEGFEIAIPAKQSRLLKLLLGPLLVVWGIEEVSSAIEVFLPADAQASGSSAAVWLIAWTCVGAFLLYLQLWMIIGVELIILRPASLLIRHEFGGFDRASAYDLQRIRNLRVEPKSRSPFSGAMHVLGIGGGPMVFDYESGRVRFGAGVDEAEATAIVEELRARAAAAGLHPIG